MALFVFLSLICFLSLSSSGRGLGPIDDKCSDDLIKLQPCLPFVQKEVQLPDGACCSSLKSVRAEAPVCLCELIASNYVAGLNRTALLGLPEICGVNADPSRCKALLTARSSNASGAVGSSDSTASNSGAESVSVDLGLLGLVAFITGSWPMSKTIAGIRNLNKPVKFALPRVYGIGRRKAAEICSQVGVGDDVKMNEIPDQLFNRIMTIINENHLVEAELVASVQMDIKRLISINCKRGHRHVAGYPVRGQRTHTNAISARTTQLEKLKKLAK